VKRKIEKDISKLVNQTGQSPQLCERCDPVTVAIEREFASRSKVDESDITGARLAMVAVAGSALVRSPPHGNGLDSEPAELDDRAFISGECDPAFGLNRSAAVGKHCRTALRCHLHACIGVNG
jgi:hypothetical protein